MKNRNSLTAAIVVAILLSVSFMAPDAEAQRRRAVERHTDTGTLVGVVTDASTGAVLASAEVTIAGTTRLTNEDGEYKFDKVAVGHWSVTAKRWGYGATTREITIGLGENRADFGLQLSPWVTLTRENGDVERFAFDTVKFGYAIPFTGTVTSPTLNVCTGSPNEPIQLLPGSIARIEGPAERVSTPCCPKFDGEEVGIQLKTGETFKAVLLDSCPPYDMYFIGRGLDSEGTTFRRFSEISSIEFPQ